MVRLQPAAGRQITAKWERTVSTAGGERKNKGLWVRIWMCKLCTQSWGSCHQTVFEFSNFMEADSLTGVEIGKFTGMFISTQGLQSSTILFSLCHPKSGEIYTST